MMNSNDLNRIEEIQKIVTKVMLGKEISINNLQKFYQFQNEELDIANLYSQKNFSKYNNNTFYNMLYEANNITFIGDSVTEGTKKNFNPWYLPLINNFQNKNIINLSKGGLRLN